MSARRLFLLVAVGIVVSLACGFVPLLLWPDWQTRSQFGDMFAAGEVVASALALGGVIIAIVLQREELQLQRRELEDTRRVLDLQREELKRSAEAQAESQRALKDQVQQLARASEIAALGALLSSYSSELEGLQATGSQRFVPGTIEAAQSSQVSSTIQRIRTQIQERIDDTHGVPTDGTDG